MTTYDHCIHCLGSGEDPHDLWPCRFCDGHGVREDHDIDDEDDDSGWDATAGEDW